jgi:hypothetical protein
MAWPTSVRFGAPRNSNFDTGEIHERGIKDDALGVADLADGFGHA